MMTVRELLEALDEAGMIITDWDELENSARELSVFLDETIVKNKGEEE